MNQLLVHKRGVIMKNSYYYLLDSIMMYLETLVLSYLQSQG